MHTVIVLTHNSSSIQMVLLNRHWRLHQERRSRGRIQHSYHTRIQTGEGIKGEEQSISVRASTFADLARFLLRPLKVLPFHRSPPTPSAPHGAPTFSPIAISTPPKATRIRLLVPVPLYGMLYLPPKENDTMINVIPAYSSSRVGGAV
ncbi:hypothetical protein F5878DRAFT_667881 [Lentinula raphanica]|uniref:Uncharacterized protein n=1 Tax=Lentinula raphanica TaxID=153919 RepID=A0AA38U3V6_9AGAR|nr:hypothetical protein F5878DRAFT_667881 [Lentinula raphanica]